MDKINHTELKHRGNAGKDIANIYYCAHHDDRELYFNKIYDAISKEIECALWFDEDPFHDPDIKKRCLELEQMSLFVIPVTNRLLTTESRAIKEELPFAKEKGIPVLPLIVEKIDNEQFDRQFASIFGNMQYLVFNQNDPTAISFNDKLKNYISSVLVSPELYERIRNAFDGYVFLSYRKKDREHVPPLMKAIHQSEELRDVAIWYDEFLTPGEDFSDNIEKNLKKSNIFILAVTPNLLESDNYVMATEYPFAIKNQKPVVAVEMVKTNREALEKSFEGLPQCLPIGAPEGISAELKSKLSLGNTERDKKSELEHKFLMGMAYFSGVDLEFDKNRALDLLEEVADVGYLEAMEQLSSFYRNGLGIRNTDARERQMSYVLLCKERYEREGTEKSALRFADALEAQGNLEDDLIRFGPPDISMLGHHPVPKASLLMIALLEKTNAKYKTITTKRKLIAAYDSICERYTITRRNGMVIDYGLKAIAILEDMAKYNYDPEIYKNIADRYHSLSGEVIVEAEQSLEYLKKALEFYKKAKGKDRSPDTLKGYIDIFESLSFCILYRVKHRFDKIVAQKHLALLEELFETAPLIENGLTLCEKYLNYAYTISAFVDFQIFTPEERVGFCQRAGELISKLFPDAEENNGIHLSLYLDYLHCTAMAYDDMDDSAHAAEFYLKYILKLENLPSNESLEKYTRSKANAYLDLSRIFERMGFDEKAAKCALKAVSLGTLNFNDYNKFMSEYIQKSDSDILAAFTTNGFDHYAKLVDKKATSNFTSLCISAYEICLKSGRPEAALKYLQSSVNAQRTVAESTGSKQQMLLLFRLLAMLGDLHLRFENKTEAVTAYLECIGTGNSIGDNDLPSDGLKILANVCRTVASFAEEEGDLERAEKYYTFALQRRYRLYLINNLKSDLNEGMSPLIAIYKKQGNKLFAIKKTHAMLKQLKKWDNE